MLTQVVLNLVQNAVQAGATTVNVVADGSQLRVLDDGPGVALELRDKIFEPFFTTKLRGTGLGLAIAKRLVETMNGSLALCDSPLGGAGFLVALPSTSL
jgi:two-component system sensor histidine kinase HydH